MPVLLTVGGGISFFGGVDMRMQRSINWTNSSLCAFHNIENSYLGSPSKDSNITHSAETNANDSTHQRNEFQFYRMQITK